MLYHTIKEEADAIVISLQGDIDLVNTPEARRLLMSQVGDATLLVDLSSVTYLGSAGVATLLEAFQQSKKAFHNFALVAVSQAAMRVLRIGHLDEVFTIHGTLQEGLSHAK